jgi:hypothetical protein
MQGGELEAIAAHGYVFLGEVCDAPSALSACLSRAAGSLS